MIYFDSFEYRNIAITILSSTLFYWYFILTTNSRDLNPSDLSNFPMNLKSINKINCSDLSRLSNDLMESYRKNKEVKVKISKLTGKIEYVEFYPRKSKLIIDEIDRVLARHYGFTDEELDFIINYDIKYRMRNALNHSI